VLLKVNFPKTSPKKEWTLTQEAFDRFLAALDVDRDKAGEKYEHIRLKLLKYFQWCGSDVPDIDADETINRVIRRIDEGANVHNLNGYIYGVARLVHAESLKQRNRKREFDQGVLLALAAPAGELEAAQYRECLQRCLRHLTKVDREVITEYYKYDKAEKIVCRRQLAARLGVSLNTLRIKTHRQRLNLEACVQECLGRFDKTDS
jgi:DNA-directed RNA polymerase specialized sigma24 family protein